MYFLNILGQKRVRDKSEMTYVCSWGRVYIDRGNCHLMVLWFHGCLFPAFPYYYIWDAEYKSSPVNTDLKSSNKDHNIKSASSVEPARRSGPRKGRACLSMCGGAWWTAHRGAAARFQMLKGKQKYRKVVKWVIWNQDQNVPSTTSITFPFVLTLTLHTSGKTIKLELRYNSEWTRINTF